MDRPVTSLPARMLNPILKTLPETLAIYVYGTTVRGEEHPGSDLDLALLLPRDAILSAFAIAQLQGDLESMAGIPVEISVLSLETGVVHCKEVVTTGNRIYVSIAPPWKILRCTFFQATRACVKIARRSSRRIRSMDDVLLNKAAIIERCLRRIVEEYAGDPGRLTNFTHQDAIVLNLERACQAAIDIAMHSIAREHLGVPQSSAQAFDLLAAAHRIDPELAGKMRRMVGFRNVAIHQYQELKIDILQQIIENGIQDFAEFCTAIGLRILTRRTGSARNIDGGAMV